jgi:putative tryptophan/tyrosine transport system substrate-binding protein
MRAWLAILLFLVPALLAAGLPASAASVVVAYESGTEAYTEALNGITDVLGANAFIGVDLGAAAGAVNLAAALDSKDLRLVIAIGGRAATDVRASRPNALLITTMVLHSDDSPTGRVELDVPLAAQLAAVRTLWPNRLRVGIIRNPTLSRYSTDQLDARVRKEGFTPFIVECDRPAGLLKAMAALKSQADFVLCFPDPTLYTTLTIKPLVLASLEDRLPLVGFSPAFVRAGAALGIYPDYRDAGRQAAEMAQRCLRGEAAGPDAGPRKVRVAVNQRITRLLGADFHRGPLPVEVFK